MFCASRSNYFASGSNPVWSASSRGYFTRGNNFANSNCCCDHQQRDGSSVSRPRRNSWHARPSTLPFNPRWFNTRETPDCGNRGDIVTVYKYTIDFDPISSLVKHFSQGWNYFGFNGPYSRWWMAFFGYFLLRRLFGINVLVIS